MERFTKKAESGNVLELMYGSGAPWTVSKADGFNHPRYTISGSAVDRLAAYEDTGMTPEQIRNAQDTLQCFDNIGIKRGNEIVKAEEEGRLVVLPCKIGKTVYKISYYHDCADNLYETCQLFAYDESACCRCYKDKLVPHIRESGFELSMLDDLGEAVFLSREEAKAALEDIRHENP